MRNPLRYFNSSPEVSLFGQALIEACHGRLPVRFENLRFLRRTKFSGATGTNWTMRHEARLAGELLQLGPGKRLLEVGAGSGWPGLYLAGTTGCDVRLVVSLRKNHPPPSGEFLGPTGGGAQCPR